MSLLTSVNEASNNAPYFNFSTAVSSYPAGNYTCVAGTTQVITISGLTTAGIVNLTYVHRSGGGGGQQQFFENVVPTANTLTVTLHQTATISEFILWSVAKF
jgi:hypothetical protein